MWNAIAPFQELGSRSASNNGGSAEKSVRITKKSTLKGGIMHDLKLKLPVLFTYSIFYMRILPWISRDKFLPKHLSVDICCGGMEANNFAREDLCFSFHEKLSVHLYGNLTSFIILFHLER